MAIKNLYIHIRYKIVHTAVIAAFQWQNANNPLKNYFKFVNDYGKLLLLKTLILLKI